MQGQAAHARPQLHEPAYPACQFFQQRIALRLMRKLERVLRAGGLTEEGRAAGRFAGRLYGRDFCTRPPYISKFSSAKKVSMNWCRRSAAARPGGVSIWPRTLDIFT